MRPFKFISKGRNAFLFILIGLGQLMLVSCNNEDEPDAPGNNGEIAVDESLGKGYNFLGRYADTEELRASILDLDKLHAAGLIDEVPIERAEFETYFGETINEYANHISTSVEVGGSFKGFGGSAAVNFSQDVRNSRVNAFATVQSRIYKESLTIAENRVSELKEYLSENAKRDINDPNYSPESLFEIYGSYVVRAIYVGGRLDYNIAMDRSEVSEDFQINVAADASFSADVVEISASAGFGNQQLLTSIQENSEKNLKVYGGNSEFGQNIFNEDDYNQWINSIDGRSTLVGFQEATPLIPIWEFADEGSRKQELIDAFETLAGVSLESLQTPPLRVKVTFEQFRVPTNVDEVGAGLEFYGDINAFAYQDRTNIFAFESHNFFSEDRNSSTLVDMAPGDTKGLNNSSKEVADFTIYNFDKNRSKVTISGEMFEFTARNITTPLTEGDTEVVLDFSNGFVVPHSVLVFESVNGKKAIHAELSIDLY